jgi:hypothetical protein
VIIQLLSFLMNHRYNFIDISYVFPVFLFTFFIIELYAKSENPFENIAWNVVGLVYILLPVLILNKLYFDKGKLFVSAILFISWFYDSWCYIFGSLIGRTKLFERVSPKENYRRFSRRLNRNTYPCLFLPGYSYMGSKRTTNVYHLMRLPIPVGNGYLLPWWLQLPAPMEI